MDRRTHIPFLLAVFILHAAATPAQQPVVAGPGNDYQADIAVPWDAPGQRVLVFERLDAGSSGDLWLTRSDDGGDSWSTPVPIVSTSGNERHPALVQTGPSAWSLFHLGTAEGGYRIFRATSGDGWTFSTPVPIDLGWPTGGEINPHVIRRADGTLVMTYQRLGGAAHIALSSDGGATWDTLCTQVSPGAAQLPRIARRVHTPVHAARHRCAGLVKCRQRPPMPATGCRSGFRAGWRAVAGQQADGSGMSCVLPVPACVAVAVRASRPRFFRLDQEYPGCVVPVGPSRWTGRGGLESDPTRDPGGTGDRRIRRGVGASGKRVYNPRSRHMRRYTAGRQAMANSTPTMKPTAWAIQAMAPRVGLR